MGYSMKISSFWGLSFGGALLALACGESASQSPGGGAGTAGFGGETDMAGGSGGSATGASGGGSDDGGEGGGAPSPTCDGAKLGEEQSRTRYSEEDVSAPEACVSEEQTRACTEDGWSTWSGSFEAKSCTVTGPEGNCGETESGESESRVRYEAATVAYGDTCTSEEQTRTCSDSEWGAWSGTFVEEACSVLPAAACGDTPHGESAERVRYLTATVEYGETCTEETQTALCENGALGEWSGTYTFGACTVGPAADCEGGAHGEVRTRTRYLAGAVAWNEACQEESQSQICNDGVWTEWTGSYTYESCEVTPPVDCAEAPHGTTLTRERYETATVPYGQTCQKEVQSQTCTNGTLSDWTGTFEFESCTVDPPASCDGTAHGDVESRTRYQSANVPFGSACVSETQTRTCDNGVWGAWNGTYKNESCTVAEPASCDGVAHGGTESRIRYKAASVPNGSTCEQEEQTRTCNDGVWGTWTGTYTFLTCAPTAGSCTLSVVGGQPSVCNDYVGSSYTQAVAQSTCPGTYSTAHCGVTKLLGVCTMFAGTTTEVKMYYYQSILFPNAAAAQANCASGNWAAP